LSLIRIDRIQQTSISPHIQGAKHLRLAFHMQKTSCDGSEVGFVLSFVLLFVMLFLVLLFLVLLLVLLFVLLFVSCVGA
jgi:hypothetical protein